MIADDDAIAGVDAKLLEWRRPPSLCRFLWESSGAYSRPSRGAPKDEQGDLNYDTPFGFAFQGNHATWR